MPTVQGTCNERFEELRTALQERLDSGDEIGASITVNIDGKNVVDIWDGYTTSTQSKHWDRDTIVNVWSSSKTIISFAILMLVDRGLLDVNANVADYWPEFAANGKENIKVRYLLSHCSGLSGWREPIVLDDLYDFKKMTTLLAEQAPWWEPGRVSGYQAITMGYLLGELVIRVTGGKTMSQFIEEEIATPLRVDFQIGAKEEDWPRVAVLEPNQAPPMELPEGLPEVLVNAMTNPPWGVALAMTAGWREADVSAANAHTNSRALSKIMSAIALGGEVDGVRLLSPETIDLIFQQQSHGVDMVTGEMVQFGIGYGICTAGDGLVNQILPKGKVAFWAGWGGSLVVADTERRMSFSYTMNKMWIGTNILVNPNMVAYAKIIYKALGVSLEK